MVQVIQNLDFGGEICSISRYIKNRIQNNDTSKIMRVERSDIYSTVYSLLQTLSAHQRFCGKKFFYAAKTLGQGKKLPD